jgi:hypothetical protein
MSALDQLDQLAREVAANSADGLQMLSFLPADQRFYVILAANRPELLKETSIVAALARIDEPLRQALMERHA